MQLPDKSGQQNKARLRFKARYCLPSPTSSTRTSLLISDAEPSRMGLRVDGGMGPGYERRKQLLLSRPIFMNIFNSALFRYRQAHNGSLVDSHQF